MKLWFGDTSPEAIHCVKEVVIRLHKTFTDSTKFISFTPARTNYKLNYRVPRNDYRKPCNLTEHSRETKKKIARGSSGSHRRAFETQGEIVRHLGMMAAASYPTYQNQEDSTWRNVNKQNGAHSGSYNANGVDDYEYLNHTGRSVMSGSQMIEQRNFGGYVIIIGHDMFSAGATAEQSSEIILHQMMRQLVEAHDMNSNGIGTNEYLRGQCLLNATHAPKSTLTDGGNFGFFIAGFSAPISIEDLAQLRSRGHDFDISKLNEQTPERQQEIKDQLHYNDAVEEARKASYRTKLHYNLNRFKG